MSEESDKPDRFGYLPSPERFVFDGGTISPVSEYQEVSAWVDEYTNEDGFLYPPLERRVKESGGKIPRTERPAHLHRIPASHELLLGATGTKEDLRRGSGAFVIHLLAYLFGIRLQFYDWWFDGRVPTRSTHNITFNKATGEEFLSQSYRAWEKWPLEDQNLLTNILFMHTRAPSYEWDWEQFMMEYMVLDGLYKLAKRRCGVGSVPHSARLNTLCKAFCMLSDANTVKEIVRLRNDLFHETLWDRSQPCTGVSQSAFMQSYNLRRLNQRLIPALLCYRTPYIQTTWWTGGSYSF